MEKCQRGSSKELSKPTSGYKDISIEAKLICLSWYFKVEYHCCYIQEKIDFLLEDGYKDGVIAKKKS